MKFYDSLIIFHEQMLDDELSAVGQNLAELTKVPARKSDFDL
jgi:electron transfer flavoprotein alpha/beta subunit